MILIAQNTKLTLDFKKTGVNVSSNLYGLMTEEINHSYDGGLYAELIKNRVFKDDPKVPVSWKVYDEIGGNASIQLDYSQPINNLLPVCLKLDVKNSGTRVGIINEGYWGIPITPKTTYKASFYVKADEVDTVSLTVSIESNDGAIIYTSAQVPLIIGSWKKYELELNTSANIIPTSLAHFVISTIHKGTYRFNLISLFPPTYNNRSNGNRPDLMRLLAEMKPTFLRFPGGNYLEGDYFSTRYQWKKTLGPLENRPGHQGCWEYRSSDGMGLLEFLEWCEDLNVEPVLGVNAGYALKGDYIEAGPFLKPFVDDALEEIEYVTGDSQTKWGDLRAKDGHPKPFKIKYVEIGNEDGFDQSGSYDKRFTQFYDAIRAKYPNLQIISTAGGKDVAGSMTPVCTRKPDVIDEHYYRNSLEMQEDACHYDNYDRNGPKIFVGEWATIEGEPTTNLSAALGDAAWMTGMERNSDLVIMSCYAPLFVNINTGAYQCKCNLIGYDAKYSYGSPSYYAQKMFSNYLGDKVVPVVGENISVQTMAEKKSDGASITTPKQMPTLFYVATQNTTTGNVYIKMVNTSGTSQTITLDLKGAGRISPHATIFVLRGDKLEETNSISEPEKIIPKKESINNASNVFCVTLKPYSINVLQMEIKK
jgi:alpha-N-arabinofuranosidase